MKNFDTDKQETFLEPLRLKQDKNRRFRGWMRAEKDFERYVEPKKKKSI